MFHSVAARVSLVPYLPFLSALIGVSCVCRQVPLVPYLPMLSVFVNVYLMMKLGPATWIRFGIWMILGKVGM